MNYENLIYSLQDLSAEEFVFLKNHMAELDEAEARKFIMFYNSKRRKPNELLLLTCLGFVVVAGIQRFVIGQIGMGILYLLTGGLCLIGTIVDLINYKSLALEYNRKMAFESLRLVKL